MKKQTAGRKNLGDLAPKFAQLNDDVLFGEVWSREDKLSPRPILFIVGDRAHSKFFSEGAYKKAKAPKELYVVEDAEHIDLYDRTDRIPFDKITEFFTQYLK